MTPDMWIVLIILAVAIVLFVTELLRVDVVALGVVVSLMLTGILTTSEALSGFSNSAVITIAALFIVGGAVLHTGLAAMIGRRILSVAGTDETRLVIVVMLAVALLSGFMSDTGTVAVLLPAIIALAQSAQLSPSKLLIPLSYGSLLGGAMTLIGTPPNLIVSDLLREEGLNPFGFFSYTPAGVLLLIGGVLFMLFIGRRLLPDTKPVKSIREPADPNELVDYYHLLDNMSYLRVREQSPLAGAAIRDAHLRSQHRTNVAAVLRDDAGGQATPAPQPAALLRRRQAIRYIYPTAGTVLEPGDLMIVEGKREDVQGAADALHLSFETAQQQDQAFVNATVGVAEVLLPPRSNLVGKTLSETDFGARNNLTVLDINRASEHTDHTQLSNTPLEIGDTLVVQGLWPDILNLRERQADFIVIGHPEEAANPATAKAPVAMMVLAGMLVIIVSGILPIAAAAMLAALGMVLTGCLTMDEAYDAIDWKSIILIAGMIPMATALENVGLIDMVATGVTDGFGASGPMVVMAMLFLLTSVFTQVLSNTATTVLIAPIALTTAQTLGVQPYAFMMAVAVAASMAFASPVASPVNTLVLGAGGYRFADYIKVGVPMIVLTLIISMLVLPILFPF